VRAVGLTATAAYLPERWMSAAEVADASGIPEGVVLENLQHADMGQCPGTPATKRQSEPRFEGRLFAQRSSGARIRGLSSPETQLEEFKHAGCGIGCRRPITRTAI